MKNKMTIEDIDVAGKRVLVRVDFNCPLYEGIVMDDTRIREALPTIKYLVEHDAKVIIASHLGRPAGGVYEFQFSMMPVVMRLIQLLGKPVTLISGPIAGDECQAAAAALQPGQIMMLENLRFNKGEKRNDLDFVHKLVNLCDIYVDDAFGASHRKHASIAGVPEFVPAVSGYLLAKEIKTLTGMLENPERPFVAILGGSKVSDKLGIIDNLMDVADTIIIGGAMCFTFLAAQGYAVGTSKMEEDMVETAKGMLERAAEKGVKLMIPTDVVVSEMFVDLPGEVVSVDAIPENKMGLDVGPETAAAYAEAIKSGKTVFWNGPMGVFEFVNFEAGTKTVAEAVAACEGQTVIGGGDSVAAIKKFGLADQVSFISTGGGASMQLLEGKELPGVAALNDKEA